MVHILLKEMEPIRSIYDLTAFLALTVDALGYSVFTGLTTMRAENTLDIVGQFEDFELSNFPQNFVGTDEPVISGVPIKNRHHICSEVGTVMFDEGAWSDGTAASMGKDLGLCVHHKKAGIMKAKGGLGGTLGQEWVKDMKTIVNGNHTLPELDRLFDVAKEKYGHESKPRNFIKTLRSKQEKICHAHMRFTFTHGHRTTQRSESGNSSIKARGELEDLLASATLVGMHDIVDISIRRNQRNALEMLISLRKDCKRLGSFFTDSLEVSMRLSATKVVSCELTKCDSVYKVLDNKGLVTFPYLKRNIVHRGVQYIIFSCTCSYWMSTKKHCKCIVLRACNEARMDIYSVKNVHPIFHVQRHPLWSQALESLNMEDYQDFDFDNTPSANGLV